jgi:hypothetical protein
MVGIFEGKVREKEKWRERERERLTDTKKSI